MYTIEFKLAVGILRQAAHSEFNPQKTKTFSNTDWVLGLQTVDTLESLAKYSGTTPSPPGPPKKLQIIIQI